MGEFELQRELRQAVLAQTLLMDAPSPPIRARLGALRALVKEAGTGLDRPVLVLHSEPRELFRLDADLVIGSAAACGIVLDGEYVSHKHCVLRKVPEGWLLEDQGSTNGVFVNGKKVERRILLDGDVIQIGRFTLTFFRETTPAGCDL
ncbi:MAG: FHA domain-containing protein [Kiritimatiellaeota bacterium]|nr:FHA domain-containing protein [Kiritimatiellota bacterium]